MVALGLISVAALLVSLTQSLLVPVLPMPTADLRTSSTNAEWLLTSSLLVAAVAVPATGRLADLYGKLCALTISAMLGIGGALALPLAGLVAEHADYHLLFWICVVSGAACLAATAYFVREAPVLAGGTMDVSGAILLGAALIPMVDLRVNARAALLLTNITSLAVGFALFATLLGTASYVQTLPPSGYGFGSSILASGLCMVPSGVFMLLFSLTSPRISAHFGPKVTRALGALVVGLGFIERIVLTGQLWQVLLGTSLADAGTGIAYPPCQA
jgi:MFS family permease